MGVVLLQVLSSHYSTTPILITRLVLSVVLDLSLPEPKKITHFAEASARTSDDERGECMCSALRDRIFLVSEIN
jgi:hypothetical protein